MNREEEQRQKEEEKAKCKGCGMDGGFGRTRHPWSVVALDAAFVPVPFLWLSDGHNDPKDVPSPNA